MHGGNYDDRNDRKRLSTTRNENEEEAGEPEPEGGDRVMGADVSLSGLNGILFEQLEALTNPDLKGEELREEINRSKAVSSIATNIVNGAKVELDTIKFGSEYMDTTEVKRGDLFFLPENSGIKE